MTMVFGAAILLWIAAQCVERWVRRWAAVQRRELDQANADLEWALAAHRIAFHCECSTYEETRSCHAKD